MNFGRRLVAKTAGGKVEKLEQDIRGVSDDTLWKFRLGTSKSLVEYTRERLAGIMPPPAHRPRRLKRRNIV